MNYTLSSTGSSWVLTFSYHHSSHEVLVDLNSKETGGLDGGSSIMILISIIATVVALTIVIFEVRRRIGRR